MSKEDADTFAKIDEALQSGSSSSSGPAAAEPVIKQEPKCELDILNDKCTHILKNNVEELKKHQDILSNALVTQKEAKKKDNDTRKYMTAFENDLVTMVTKETYIVKQLTKYLSGDFGMTEDMPKLIKAIDIGEKLWPTIEHWAAKHDCLAKAPSTRKRKLETAAEATPKKLAAPTRKKVNPRLDKYHIHDHHIHEGIDNNHIHLNGIDMHFRGDLIHTG